MLTNAGRAAPSPLDAALSIVADEISMCTPLGTAKLILSNRSAMAHLPRLQSMLRSSAWQAIVRTAAERHVEEYDQWGQLPRTANFWQDLGVAIAGGADEDLIFSCLADVGWRLPRAVATTDMVLGEQFLPQCPYPYYGPCGGPLFAACDLGNIAVATLLLKCRADPLDDRQVDQWSGGVNANGWGMHYDLSSSSCIRTRGNGWDVASTYGRCSPRCHAPVRPRDLQ